MTEVKITEHYFTCDREECEARYEMKDSSDKHIEADGWTVFFKPLPLDVKVHFCPEHNPYHAQKYQGDLITLGELKDWLEKLPDDVIVRFNNGSSPGVFDSYRGYYEHIALDDHGPTPPKVIHFLSFVNKAIGSTHTGWKGGEYKMTRGTPIWVAENGIASGEGIVGMEYHSGNDAILVTRKVE